VIFAGLDLRAVLSIGANESRPQFTGKVTESSTPLLGISILDAGLIARGRAASDLRQHRPAYSASEMRLVTRLGRGERIRKRLM
jgi:hypothetical protein